MKLVFVEAVPEIKRERHIKRDNNKLDKFIQTFVLSGKQVARVDLDTDEYVHGCDGCYTVLCNAVRRSKHPIKVARRRGSVYLVRKI